MMIPMVLWQRTALRSDPDDDRPSLDPVEIRNRRRPRHSTIGYTLLELMIVLAIMGVLAAVSMPALMRPWSRSHVQQAAQQLSRALLKARLDAIQYGRAYQFRWRERTGEYEIFAWQDASQRDPQSLEGESLVPRTAPPRLGATEPLTHRVRDRSDDRDVAGDRDVADERSTIRRAQSAQRRVSGRLANGVVFVPDSLPTASQQTVSQQLGRPTSAPNRDPLTPMDQSLPPARGGLQQPAPHRPWTEPIWFFPDGRASTAELLLQDEDGYTIRLALRGMTGTVRVGVVKKLDLPTALDSGEPRITTDTNLQPAGGQRR